MSDNKKNKNENDIRPLDPNDPDIVMLSSFDMRMIDGSYVVSNVSTARSGVTKTFLNTETEFSVGKSRDKSIQGYSYMLFGPENPSQNVIRTSGSGRAEPLDKQLLPSLEITSIKKHKNARNGKLYAKIRKKHDDNEGVDYFDILLGKKKEDRATAPHIGFRPSGARHFLKPGSNVDAISTSTSDHIYGSGVIYPKEVGIAVMAWNIRLTVQLSYNELKNVLKVEKIEFA